MGGHKAQTYWEQRGLFLLVLSFMMAPMAWLFDQALSYVLVKWVCASGNTQVLTAIAVGALVITVAGLWLGWSAYGKLRGAHDDGGAREDRSYFLAVMAMAFNVFTALLIATALVPRYVLSPCE